MITGDPVLLVTVDGDVLDLDGVIGHQSSIGNITSADRIRPGEPDRRPPGRDRRRRHRDDRRRRERARRASPATLRSAPLQRDRHPDGEVRHARRPVDRSSTLVSLDDRSIVAEGTTVAAGGRRRGTRPRLRRRMHHRRADATGYDVISADGVQRFDDDRRSALPDARASSSSATVDSSCSLVTTGDSADAAEPIDLGPDSPSRVLHDR